MIRTTYVALAVLFLCIGGAASAGEFAYACEVTHVYHVADDGSLKRLPALEKVMWNNRFPSPAKQGCSLEIR